MSMDEAIRRELDAVTDEHDVRIVNARAAGSRMLGVAHEDSDWDVKFLFAQEPAVYATIHGRVDTIDRPHVGENGEIDLHGWNVDKFGDMVRDSNPDSIQYCRPNATEYVTFGHPSFNRMARDARRNFNRMALYHHYISMAKHNYEKYIGSGNDMSKSRQFYVAQALAAAQYIRRTNELPPMDALELAECEQLQINLRHALERLAHAKDHGAGEQVNPDLVGPLLDAEDNIELTPTDERTRSPDDELIDDFIRAAIGG